MSTTILNRKEVEKAVKVFSKFNAETSGMEIICACINHIKLSDDYDTNNRPAILEKLITIRKFRNIFDNQIPEIVDFIMSIEDEDFKETVQRRVNNNFHNF